MSLDNSARPEPAGDKCRLRACLRRERPASSTAWIRWASDRVADGVMAALGEDRPRRAALYLALPDEVQTNGLIRRLFRTGTVLCVPAWDPLRGAYALADYRPDAALAIGPDRAREPARIVWVDREQVDCWIVPALAFDRTGGRLGRGGGSFDRLLQGRRGIAVGVGFSFQLTRHVPREPHDELVDLVITECEAVDCRLARANLK